MHLFKPKVQRKLIRSQRNRSGRFRSESLEPRRLFAGQPVLDLAGHLDTSFGNGTGEISVPFGGTAITAVRNSILQPDGKTVIVGQAADPAGGTDFAVARINADGTPDTAFGTNGLVELPQDGNTDSAFGVALQADNKIVVAGSFTDIIAGQEPPFAFSIVVRLNTDGSIDTSFGNSGFINGDFYNSSSGATNGEARAVVVQTDGNIVVAGGAEYSPSNIQGEFARYLPDGTPDFTFGQDGKVLLPILLNPVEEILGIALQTDGKIVAVGTSTGTDGGLGLVLRLNTDGSLDTTFGDGGGFAYNSPLAMTGSFSAFTPLTVQVQPNGDILAGGFDYENNEITGEITVEAFVGRLLPDGSADRSFGTRGSTETDFTGFNSIENLHVLADGRILGSGIYAGTREAVLSSNFDPAVFQFRANGTLDTSFGTGGRTLVPAPTVAASSLITADIITADDTSSMQQLTNFENQTATISLTPGGAILVVSGNGDTVTVAELIGNGPVLIPVVTGVKPVGVLGGTKRSLVVNVQNEGNDPASGSVTVSILASTDTSVSSDDAVVGQISGPLTLVPGRRKHSFKVNFIYPASLPNGDYFILAEVVSPTIPDAAPGTNIVATPFAVPVTQPFVLLAGQIHGTPVVTSKVISISLALANQGNVPAKGFAQLQLFASTDTALDANDTALNSQIQDRVQIKANGIAIIKFHLRRTPGSFTGDDFILIDLGLTQIALSQQAQMVVPSAVPILFP